MAKMKLADWARKNGLSYITAHRHFHAGMIPNAHQLDSGTILVEDDSPEQTMMGNSSNDAMSLFLKKTVEYSKSNATVEDFAAYVISNFNLKLNGVADGPRYSKRPPKAEDIQKHFQQFIPKQGEKPKPNSFVMDPEDFEEIPAANIMVNKTDVDPNLVKEFSFAVGTASMSETTPLGATSLSTDGAMSAEGTVTRSVDLNTTPQQTNYTGSNNLTFSGSPPYATTAVPAGYAGNTFTSSLINNGLASGIDCVPTFDLNSTYYVGMTSGQPDAKIPEVMLNQSAQPPRAKRGRKPSKR